MIKYNVENRIGVLATYPNGMSKELNMVSWNDSAAKYDIRQWNEDHTKMSKGITMTEEETCTLMEILAQHFNMILLEREEED